jgi:hypothetical protein
VAVAARVMLFVMEVMEASMVGVGVELQGLAAVTLKEKVRKAR